MAWADVRQDLLDLWVELRRDNRDLASPFFHPLFTAAVANSCNNVEVALIEDDVGTAAIFPFQRLPGGIGVPVGHFLSDYHGLICEPDFHFDPRDLVQQCGLNTLDFDHLSVSQKFFRPFHRGLDQSPQIDLFSGFEFYSSQQSVVSSERGTMRRLERMLGPLRFVAHSTEEADLRQILTWKRGQYAKTGVADVLSDSWVVQTLKTIHATQTADFSGSLSLLYAGERLVAGHFGMRSDDVWHYWFPAYDPALAKFSPGILLLLKMAEHAPGAGINLIDLGRGLSSYKKRFMNTSAVVASGSIERPSFLHAKRLMRRSISATLKTIHLR